MIFYLSYELYTDRIAQSVTCVFDCRSRGPDFDPGPEIDFVEIDHEIISTAILFPSTDSRRVVVSCKRKYAYTKYWLTAQSSLTRKKVVR